MIELGWDQEAELQWNNPKVQIYLPLVTQTNLIKSRVVGYRGCTLFDVMGKCRCLSAPYIHVYTLIGGELCGLSPAAPSQGPVVGERCDLFFFTVWKMSPTLTCFPRSGPHRWVQDDATSAPKCHQARGTQPDPGPLADPLIAMGTLGTCPL